MIVHENLKDCYSPDWQTVPGWSYSISGKQKKINVWDALVENTLYFFQPLIFLNLDQVGRPPPDRAAIRPKTLGRNVLVCWPYHSNMSLFTLMRTPVGELRARLDTHRLQTDPAFVFYAGFSRRRERSRKSFSAGSPNIGVFTWP